MIGPDHGGRRRQRRGEARRILAVLGHHRLHNPAGSGRIRDGRARHAGEDHALDDVDLGQTAAETPDQRIAEAQQALRHRADIHQLRRQDEERHGEDDVVRVHAVEQLLGGDAEILACQQQVEDRAGDHRMADRQAEQRQRDDRQDGEGERAGHTPEPALVGSNSSGALPRMAVQPSQR
jgi:hypothetical protein